MRSPQCGAELREALGIRQHPTESHAVVPRLSAGGAIEAEGFPSQDLQHVARTGRRRRAQEIYGTYLYIGVVHT